MGGCRQRGGKGGKISENKGGGGGGVITSGCLMGISTASFMLCFTSSCPPISAHRT